MPIIESVPETSSLGQGDILDGVPLYQTGDWWSENAQGAAVSSHKKLCLVLSRPCVIAHKEIILVCPIEVAGGTTPDEAKSADDLLGFLTELRDGDGSPDRLYLGDLPGKKGRFFAKLDSIHTIELPRDKESLERIRKRRSGRLSADFVRDLHSRLFRCFASLGFDDVRWMNDADLDLLASQCQTEIAAAEVFLGEKRRAAGNKLFSGQQLSPTVIPAAEKALADLRTKWGPYIEELERRRKPPELQG